MVLVVRYLKQILQINDITNVTLAFDEDQHNQSRKDVISLIIYIYSYHIFQVKNGSRSRQVKERPAYKRLKNYD